MATILVVDDELIVRRVIGDALRQASYRVETAGDIGSALELMGRVEIDLLLLDLQLGASDGLELLRQARQFVPQLPVIILTAHGSLPSAIEAVRQSVADYLLKPVSMEALRTRVAEVLTRNRSRHAREERIRAMYTHLQALMQEEGLIEEHDQRATQATPISGREALEQGKSYTTGPLVIDVPQHQVRMGQQIIEVTPTEFTILLEMVRQPGAVITCAQLVYASQAITLDEEEARQVVRPHIVRLRRKVEPNPQHPTYIQSVRGMGYRWDTE